MSIAILAILFIITVMNSRIRVGDFKDEVSAPRTKWLPGVIINNMRQFNTKTTPHCLAIHFALLKRGIGFYAVFSGTMGGLMYKKTAKLKAIWLSPITKGEDPMWCIYKCKEWKSCTALQQSEELFCNTLNCATCWPNNPIVFRDWVEKGASFEWECEKCHEYVGHLACFRSKFMSKIDQKSNILKWMFYIRGPIGKLIIKHECFDCA